MSRIGIYTYRSRKALIIFTNIMRLDVTEEILINVELRLFVVILSRLK